MLAVCGGALATSTPVKVTVDLTGYRSFERAWNATHPSFNAADVTELVIIGQSDRGTGSDPNDWKQADGEYLKNNFTNLETLDISGHTGGYSDLAFEECGFKNVRLRENIKLPSGMFSKCAKLTTLAVGNRAFTKDVIDLRGCDASFTRNGEKQFEHSGIIRLRLPADIALTGSSSVTPFESCASLTTLALGDRPFVDKVVDLTGYSFDYYNSKLFLTAPASNMCACLPTCP